MQINSWSHPSSGIQNADMHNLLSGAQTSGGDAHARSFEEALGSFLKDVSSFLHQHGAGNQHSSSPSFDSGVANQGVSNAAVAAKQDTSPVSDQSSKNSASKTSTASVGNSSDSGGKVVQTGTGTSEKFNVVNNTSHTETLAFSSDSSKESGYSGNVNAVMTLKPGEKGTFVAGQVTGERIEASNANGDVHADEALFEDSTETNPMTGQGVVHNPDISDVDGKKDYNGNSINMKLDDNQGKVAGNGTTAGAYMYPTQDTDPNSATNPMNMALDSSRNYTITLTDA